MDRKAIWRGLWSWFLCFTLAVPLTGCGGGGSSGSPPSTPASVSGVVADGYLVGATVFSDRDGDKRWDEGEPKAVTGEGGRYTLEGDDLDKHTIVVIVDVDVVDEDTGAAVGQKYILSTPADKPEFISPLTTLAQQQMEKNPALTSEQAEKVIMTQSGAGEGLSVFRDYVAEKVSNSDYENLHKVARVVASTFGEVQEKVEAAAESAGQTPEAVMDALVDIVVQRVMEKLTDIAISIEEAGDSFDSETISGSIVAGISTPTAENINDEIDQAQTPVTVSSFQNLLEEGGTHWLWSEKWFDGSANQYELEYGIVTLEEDGKTLAEEMYDYDFSLPEWVATTDDSGYVLVDGEWIPSSEGADGGTISFNPDGSAVFTQPNTGIESRISVVETDLFGKSMTPYLGAFADFLSDTTKEFPDGAKAYRLGVTAISSQIELDGDSWFTDAGINFDDLLTRFAKGGSERIYISREISFQLGADGTVDIFNNSSTTPVKKWSSTWSDLKIAGQTIWLVNLPPIVKLLVDVEGEYLLIKWTNGTAQDGEYRIAGVVEQGDFEFNKIAFDAFMANLDLGGKEGGSEPAPQPTEEAYSTADLSGTWYARGLYTQKDGQPDHFGYDIGTFVFDGVGNFTGTMWDENGESWPEADTASVNQDGTVNLWESEQGMINPTAMNSSKDVMIGNYQDDDEYAVRVWAKKGDSYATSDLAGTWHVAGLSTQKNGRPDNFGAGFSTFTFDATGRFTGSTNNTGDTWEESDTASINADGTVNLWESEQGLVLPTAMNASKDVMISNFQDNEEYAFDVWMKAGSSYATADLAGTWHFRGLCTQKNGQPDNLGYDIGVYQFNADGSFTGTMWAADGESWTEADSAVVNPDGTFKLWGSSSGYERQTAMNAGKNVMASRYEGEDDLCMDVWVKAAE